LLLACLALNAIFDLASGLLLSVRLAKQGGRGQDGIAGFHGAARTRGKARYGWDEGRHWPNGTSGKSWRVDPRSSWALWRHGPSWPNGACWRCWSPRTSRCAPASSISHALDLHPRQQLPTRCSPSMDFGICGWLFSPGSDLMVLAAGAMGPTGPPGASGPRGSDGVSGAAGATGPPGPPGQHGQVRFTSLIFGSDYFTECFRMPCCVCGSLAFPADTLHPAQNGINGHPGAQGQHGVQGPPGPMGPIGPTGQRGPAGLKGADGVP